MPFAGCEIDWKRSTCLAESESFGLLTSTD